MKHKLLIFGFISSISILVFVGIYALNVNQQIIISFKTGEKHFKDIATAATEVSSYAKRAEGHLLLYLTLHRKEDKEKFPKRIASLHEKISILDQTIKNPEARAILEKIKADTGDLLSIGNTLIAYHDSALKDKGKFEIESHQSAILKLHKNLSAVRELGVNLTEFEIGLETDLKSKALQKAKHLRFYLLFLMISVFGFAMYLGYILNQMINALNKEVADRIQSEKLVTLESNKLREAFAKIKVLSGLLPICAACKKIRDDKGYWNQIEHYIRDHSDAKFSHGICPECAKEFYPDPFEGE